jgi:outer membrane protein assembly factor BamD
LVTRQKERYQAALDEYFSFMEEYPESKYSKEVKRIYQDTAKYLKLGDTANLSNIQ